MAIRSQTQRVFLFGFIASICGCGLVGIWVFAAGNFGSFEGRILGTTFLAAGIFLLALLAAVPTARRTWHPIGPIAMASLPIPLVLTLMEIWRDYSGSTDWDYYRELERWIGASWTVSLTLCCTSLVSLARLRRSWRWIIGATVIVGWLLAFLILCVIFGDLSEDPWARIVGIDSILTVCGLISLPILHKLSAIPASEHVVTTKLELSLTCPRCEKTQVLTVGESTCSQCKLKFKIEIEEDHCRKCGYVLYKLESPICPECGTPVMAGAAAGTPVIQ